MLSEHGWFQFHLSTAIVMMLVAGAMLPLALPYLPFGPDYQAMASATKWDLTGTVGNFKESVEKTTGPYLFEVQPKPYGSYYGSDLVILDAKHQALHTFPIEAQKEAPFIYQDSVIYYADYCPISSGCKVIAFDLSSGKQLWEDWLNGIGPVAHSKYSNRVAMRMQGSLIIVYGKESSGSYVEFVDKELGTTVGHKLFCKVTPFPINISRSILRLPKLLLMLGIIANVTLAVGLMCEWAIRSRTARKKA